MSAMTPSGPKWKVDIGVYGDPDGDADLAFARCPMVTRRPGEEYERESERLAALHYGKFPVSNTYCE